MKNGHIKNSRQMNSGQPAITQPTASQQSRDSLGRIMIMLPRNIPTSAPLLGIFGFGNLVLFGSE
ncbi:hypothetical protein QTG54_015835 [Skeletonema marinoi]|uniref:Uncharacterized protein n=1 Tax=Skeletonema marinoi TaxID=267567 RepID=A0AAD8XU47_9STRA|nr:hypothetical protein QTG54_015835 [Skeletonema marinoi]